MRQCTILITLEHIFIALVDANNGLILNEQPMPQQNNNEQP